MYNPLLDEISKKRVLLAAHRGTCRGNIPCNSLPAYQIALRQNADIVELDVECSKDKKLFIQHPKMEKVHLRFNDSLREYDSDFISKMMLSNADLIKTQYPILRLEEALDFLRGKCFINIDKFWGCPDLIAPLIRERGMQDQVIVKCNANEEDLKNVEEYASDLPFMPLARETTEFYEEYKTRNLRFVGAEAIFTSDSSPVASPEFIEKMHNDGKFLWVNAIVYDYNKVLSGDGHNDDVAITGNEEKGWGWLAERGFDIIQTDWLTECDTYLKRTGKRIYKKKL